MKGVVNVPLASVRLGLLPLRLRSRDKLRATIIGADDQVGTLREEDPAMRTPGSPDLIKVVLDLFRRGLAEMLSIAEAAGEANTHERSLPDGWISSFEVSEKDKEGSHDARR